MTIIVTWQLGVTVNSLRNSCDVLSQSIQVKLSQARSKSGSADHNTGYWLSQGMWLVDDQWWWWLWTMINDWSMINDQWMNWSPMPLMKILMTKSPGSFCIVHSIIWRGGERDHNGWTRKGLFVKIIFGLFACLFTIVIGLFTIVIGLFTIVIGLFTIVISLVFYSSFVEYWFGQCFYWFPWFCVVFDCLYFF